MHGHFAHYLLYSVSDVSHWQNWSERYSEHNIFTAASPVPAKLKALIYISEVPGYNLYTSNGQRQVMCAQMFIEYILKAIVFVTITF